MAGIRSLSDIQKIKNQLDIKATKLCQSLLKKGLVLTTAESCTGGLVSAFVTSVDGSSKVFDCSFITYSNSAKSQMLSVSSQNLLQFGALSEVVAKEMLLGAIEKSNATIGVAITGIAGPSGGTKGKPVGTVCFAWGDKNKINTSTELFQGGRSQVRYLAVKFAFEQLLAFLKLC